MRRPSQNAMLKFLAILGLSLLHAEDGIAQTCPPAEIGLPYAVSAPYYGVPVHWDVLRNTSVVDQMKCFVETGCTFNNGPLGNLTITVDLTRNVTSLTFTTVEIKYTAAFGEVLFRDLGVYSFSYGCSSLEAFAPPFFVPQCRLTRRDTEIDFECGTRLYPEGRCILMRPSLNQWAPTLNKTTSIVDRNDYYETFCQYTLPVTSVPEGNHMLSVFIYPNVTDGILKGRQSSPLLLTISDPLAQLEPSCYTPYTTGFAHCLCFVPPDLYPPATAAWYDASDQAVEQYMTTTSGPNVTLTVSYNRYEITPTYKCRARSSRGEQNGWNFFQAQFNLPPKEYDIVVNDTTPVKSVVEPGSKVEITCGVSGNHSDAALTLVSGFDQAKQLQTPGNKTGISIAGAQCENSGRYICPQEDFSMISPDLYVDIFVECPMTAPPKASTSGEDVLTVTSTYDDGRYVIMKLLGYPDPDVTVDKEIEEGNYVPLKKGEYTNKSDRAELPPPAVVVTIQLLDNHDEGTGRYAVTLDNRRGPPYIQKFDIKLSNKSGEEMHFLISGIAVGCAIAAIIVTIFLVCWYRRRKQRKQKETEERNLAYSTLNDAYKDDYGTESAKGNGKPPAVPSRDGRPPVQDFSPQRAPQSQSDRRASVPEVNTHKTHARLQPSSDVPSSGPRPSAPAVETSTPTTWRPSLPHNLDEGNPGVDTLVDNYITPVAAKPTPLYSTSIQEAEAAKDGSYVPFDPETNHIGEENGYITPIYHRQSDISSLYPRVNPDDVGYYGYYNNVKTDDHHDDENDKNINDDN